MTGGRFWAIPSEVDFEGLDDDDDDEIRKSESRAWMIHNGNEKKCLNLEPFECVCVCAKKRVCNRRIAKRSSDKYSLVNCKLPR